MPPKRESTLPPIAFPHYIGPGTRGLTTALLFHGRLVLTLPGWMNPGVIDAFTAVLQRACERAHPLEGMLRTIGHHFELVQKHAIAEMEAITPLGGRISRVMTVYSGTSDAFASWERVRASCLEVLTPALNDPLQMNVATMELIWRLWEHALEKGHDPDSRSDFKADEILDYFQQRAIALGGPDALIAESALNRYTISKGFAYSLATDSEVSLQVLARMGHFIASDIGDTVDAQREALAFFLFDRLAHKYVGPLYPSNVARVATLMSEHSGALDSLKTKCLQQAGSLLDRPPAEAHLVNAVSSLLQQMEEEAAEIAQLDRNSVRSYLEELAQDSKVWATVAGFLAGLGTLPAPVLATLGITALSLMGAGATKSVVTKQRKLRKSAWRFLYYASSR